MRLERVASINTNERWDISLFLEHIYGIVWWKRGAIVTFFWALLYLPGITTVEIDKSDGRRVYPSLKMLETGNWFVPEYGGERYFRKPPMFNWMIALSVKIFGGANDFSVRIPTRFCLLLFSLFVVGLPSLWLSARERLFAALIFLSSFGIIEIGREVEIDACYVAFTGMAILFWLNAYSFGKESLFLWMPSALALGIALLLKGPLALLFYYATIFFVLNCAGKLKLFFSFSHLCSIGLMLLIFFAWYFSALSALSLEAKVLESKISGTWFSEILYRLNPVNLEFKRWGRGILGTVLAFLPWLLFLPFVFRKNKFSNCDGVAKIANSEIDDGLRISLIFLFALFCLMPGLKPRYFMPMYPVASFLLAASFSSNKEIKFASFWHMAIRIMTFVFALTSIILLLLFMYCRFFDIPFKVFLYLNLAAKNISIWGYLLMIFSCIFTFCGLFLRLERYRVPNVSSIDFRFSAIIWFVLCASLIVAAFLMPVKQEKENGRKFATELDGLVDQDSVLFIHSEICTEVFLFYMRRPFREFSDSVRSDGNFKILWPAEKFDNQPPNSIAMKYGKKKYFLINPGQK